MVVALRVAVVVMAVMIVSVVSVAVEAGGGLW